jgi:hypothetical protein
MGLFNHHSDSVMFDNPCPPGCETCCPLDIQLAYDPVTNILTLTYIYDDATVARTVDLTDLQEPLTIGLTFNPTTNIITLAGTYAGIPFSSNIDISHSFDLELVLNGTILELTGEHDGSSVFTSVDLAPIIPVLPVGLFYSEDNITYYDVSGTLQLTEYIIVVTTDLLTLTLPATPVLGQMYKIYCTVPGTTINGNVGQIIIGSGSSVSMILGDGMIFQYIKTNQWGVINL